MAVSFSYQLVEVTARDRCLLQGLLRLVEDQLSAKWVRAAESQSASILLIDVDSEEGWTRFWSLRDQAGVVALSSRAIPDARWVLLKPMQGQDLAAMLNQLTECLDPAAAGFATETATGPSLPVMDLSAWLAEVRRAAQPVVLKLGNLTTLCILAGGQEYRSLIAAETLQAQIRSAGRGEYRVYQTDAEAIAAARAEHLAPRPLGELLWIAGNAQGARSELIDVDRRFRLSTLPKLGSMRYHPHHLRCSTLLFEQACTARELAALVSLELSEVIGFLTACELLGVLEEIPAAGVAESESTSRTPRASSRNGEEDSWAKNWARSRLARV